MKPFVVKPFVVDPNAPQWRYFILAALSYFLGAGLVATSLIETAVFGSHDETVSPTLFGMLAVFLGTALVAIGKLIRAGQHYKADVAKRIAEQDERIRNLEAQLAALTTPTPTH